MPLNLIAQLREMAETSPITREEAAERCGTSVENIDASLAGTRDLTISELSLLLVAYELCLTEITPTPIAGARTHPDDDQETSRR